jgi:hypothetical protein
MRRMSERVPIGTADGDWRCTMHSWFNSLWTNQKSWQLSAEVVFIRGLPVRGEATCATPVARMGWGTVAWCSKDKWIVWTRLHVLKVESSEYSKLETMFLRVFFWALAKEDVCWWRLPFCWPQFTSTLGTSPRHPTASKIQDVWLDLGRGKLATWHGYNMQLVSEVHFFQDLVD